MRRVDLGAQMERMQQSKALEQFLRTANCVVRATVTRVRGSAPREVGAFILISASDQFGTIGGGRLEFDVIETARDMLNSGCISKNLDIALGPEIGQCCGGRVEVALQRLGQSGVAELISEVQEQDKHRPAVYILGAGHVGRELANLLQHLPLRTALVDQRAEELAKSHADVEKILSAIPEFEIMNAPAGSAFVVLTHDHALDFLLTSSALERGDASYVGLIGSATKRAKFRNWCKTQCKGASLDQLICPIGATGSGDKRPAIIAAFVLAELLSALAQQDVTQGNFC